MTAVRIERERETPQKTKMSDHEMTSPSSFSDSEEFMLTHEQ